MRSISRSADRIVRGARCALRVWWRWRRKQQQQCSGGTPPPVRTLVRRDAALGRGGRRRRSPRSRSCTCAATALPMPPTTPRSSRSRSSPAPAPPARHSPAPPRPPPSRVSPPSRISASTPREPATSCGFTATNVTGTTSSSFAITAPVRTLSIATQPSGCGHIRAQFSTQPVVQVRSNGVLDTTDNTTVVTASIRRRHRSCRARLCRAPRRVTAVGGVATFTNLGVERGRHRLSTALHGHWPR